MLVDQDPAGEQAARQLGAGFVPADITDEQAIEAALVLHVLDNPMLNGETVRLDAALRIAPR